MGDQIAEYVRLVGHQPGGAGVATPAPGAPSSASCTSTVDAEQALVDMITGVAAWGALAVDGKPGLAL